LLETTMTQIPHAFMLAFALAALTAHAADKPQPSAMDKAESAVAGMKEKARLATLCDHCAVVDSTRSEKRKGKASGVGAVGGAVAGGVVGNKTTDSTIGTVGGAAVGGLLGNEIEKRVKRTRVWITTVTMKDGSTRKFEASSDPKWTAGTVVEVGTDGHLKKH
jgi:outer membrane lipoprotein SlyB